MRTHSPRPLCLCQGTPTHPLGSSTPCALHFSARAHHHTSSLIVHRVFVFLAQRPTLRCMHLSPTHRIFCVVRSFRQRSPGFTVNTLPCGRHTLWLTTRTQPAASCTRKILLFATMNCHVSLAQTWGIPWRFFFSCTLSCDIRVCCGRAHATKTHYRALVSLTSSPPAPLPRRCFCHPSAHATVAKNAFAVFAGKKGTLNKNELADVLRVLGFIPTPAQLPGA